MSTDVVITGMGVTAPTGLSVKEYWNATLAGTQGIAPLQEFDPSPYTARLAGQITGFEAKEHLPGRLLPQTDRVTRLALVAADRALEDAQVDIAELGTYECGVVTSNATGGFEFSHREMQRLWTQGPDRVSVYQCFAWFYAVNTGQISIRHKMRGPGGVVVAEQAGGLDAIGHARRTITRGRSRLMVTGGVESSFDPWGWVSHLASGTVSTATDPATAYLPFDQQACGYVPGEGGALFVMEDAESARGRTDRRPYGKITGYAATFDPAPETQRPSGLRRALDLALADAGLQPDAIDLVVADAAGVADLDAQEADALRSVFGPYGVPVCAPKTMVGRLMAGGGPLDVVCALLALRDNVIPPAVNVTDVVDDYQIDLVRDNPRTCPLSRALVLARGAGGFNSAVIVEHTP
ncbi:MULTISPECIES: ketosynthase chain-length factor [Streptomyces]|uniref:Act minimal PKS chain-length factor (CLF/KS beta) n=1 Tax=Streptomyces atratus TaxID=1893 RepID=A0A1K1X6E1_STRAR|nr:MULTISPECIES: ketosynthase chain-length factor [Streptomyces]MCX4393240.1 ketosynthase chain-length factor [Streptomyces sp. NBC_01767]SFX45265.1 act minimal PKS chain-length factor (CLF/KS beta) [Streptomyces atratus]